MFKKITNLNLNNIIKYLFYVFIFCLPFQTRWIYKYGELNGGQWEYGTMALFGTEILLWAIFLIYIVLNFKIKKISLINKWLFIFLFCCSLLFLVSALLLGKYLSIYQFLHLIEAGVLFYLVSKINFDFKKISYIIFGSVFVQACLGIWQFMNQNVVANKWLGVSAKWPHDLGVAVVETGLRRFLRVYGTFSHPNVLAGFLAIGFLIGLFLIVNNIVETKKQLYQKLILIFANLVVLMSLLFTFSRSAWISLSVVLLFYCFFILKNGDNNKKSNLKRFIFYSILLASAIIFIFKEPFLVRVQGVNRLEKKSINERISYFQESWQLIKQRPLGVGPGGYTLAVHNFIDPSRNSWSYQPVHNVYLLIFVELGITGLVLMLVLACLIFIKLKKSYIDRLILSFLFFIFLISFFDHYWWTSYFGLMIVGLVLGLIFKKDERKKFLNT